MIFWELKVLELQAYNLGLTENWRMWYNVGLWHKPYCVENVMGGIVMELQSSTGKELKGRRNCLCTDKETEKNYIISCSLEIIGFGWNCVNIKRTC